MLRLFLTILAIVLRNSCISGVLYLGTIRKQNGGLYAELNGVAVRLSLQYLRAIWNVFT